MGAAPVLMILKNGEPIRSCAIEGEALLGRGEGCVIRLDDRAISRQHAVFRATGSGVQVEKKSEFAPLVVNGAECTQAILKEGDVISIGPYLMKFSMEAGGPPAPIAKREPSPVEMPKSAADLMEDPTPISSPSLDVRFGHASGESEAPHEEVLEDSPRENEFALDPPLATDEASPAQDLGAIDDAASTKILTQGAIEARIMLPGGAANVSELVLEKDEISIGRGKNCDVVLNDKKVSRKNTLIIRNGQQFIVRDLQSVNGTFVNGTKITEQELSSDDVIRIGDVEIRFQAMSANYARQEQNFLAVPEMPVEEPIEEIAPAPMVAAMAPPMDMGVAAPQPGGVVGIAGIGGPTPGGKQSLMEKFRALPKPRQYMVIGLIVALLYFGLLEEDEDPAPKKSAVQAQKKTDKKAAKDSKEPKTLADLTPEQKRFIESQHELAFNYYKNKDYDNALFALSKIFALVGDYKDAKEIQRYAEEGQRRERALAEEKRRKEEEAKLKARIAELTDEIRAIMLKKEYEKAKDRFADLLSIDPENQDIAKWRKEIAEVEEEKRQKEQVRQVIAEVNRRAWDVYREGEALKNEKRYKAAIKVFKQVKEVGASDKRPAAKAEAAIQEIREAISGELNPVLDEAKSLEQSGDLAKAYPLFEKATTIDPDHPEGYAGMKRIKGVLHDRAKVLYTEAILAESYSDFKLAKQKFQDCVDTAPKDDIYHERAQRKLARYFKIDEKQGH